MSMMPVTRPFAPRVGLGPLPASVAAGGGPPMPPVPAQPRGPGGTALMDVLEAVPPVSRMPSAGVAAGGIAPPPTTGGVPIQPPSGPVEMPAPAAQGSSMGRGRLLAGILADMLAGATGRPGMFAQTMQRQREMEDQRNYDEVLWHRDRDAKREDAMRPRVEQVGDSIGMLDPQAQSFEPFYRRPQAFEAYAQAQGLQPGTPEYAQAVEDYRLGSWSDPALENRTGLEEVKADSRSEFEAIRAANRMREVNARIAATRRGQDITRRGQDLTDARIRRGQDVSSRDRRGSAGYQGRGGRGGNAATAVGPDGRRIVVRNGKWVDAQTGQPVQ